MKKPITRPAGAAPQQERPRTGGSFIRQTDGTLTRAEEDAPAEAVPAPASDEAQED